MVHKILRVHPLGSSNVIRKFHQTLPCRVERNEKVSASFILMKIAKISKKRGLTGLKHMACKVFLSHE